MDNGSNEFIPPGTIYRFGKPYPLAPAIDKKLCSAISAFPEITSAYFPLCRIDGVIDTPTHILFIVLRPNEDHAHVVPRLVRQIQEFWPDTEALDVIPVRYGNSIVESLQEADCALEIGTKTGRAIRRIFTRRPA